MIAALFAILISADCAFAAEPPFADPAPPTVNSRSDATPAAQKNPDVTVHVAAKPLDKAAFRDWPCFLGPTHNEFSTETKLLPKFPAAGPALVWEMSEGRRLRPAGDGWRPARSVSPCRKQRGRRLSAGQRRLARLAVRISNRLQDRYGYCNGPRSSPAVAGDGSLPSASAAAFLLQLANGNVIWRRDLLKEFKLKQNFFGVGASPLVEGRQFIVNLGAPDGPCVAAFDIKTGNALGRGQRMGTELRHAGAGHVQGKRRVLVFAGGESRPPTGGLLCIDPANGHVDSTFPWRGTRHDSVNASSPVIVGNQIFISECYGSGGVMLDISAGPHRQNPPGPIRSSARTS